MIGNFDPGDMVYIFSGIVAIITALLIGRVREKGAVNYLAMRFAILFALAALFQIKPIESIVPLKGWGDFASDALAAVAVYSIYTAIFSALHGKPTSRLNRVLLLLVLSTIAARFLITYAIETQRISDALEHAVRSAHVRSLLQISYRVYVCLVSISIARMLQKLAAVETVPVARIRWRSTSISAYITAAFFLSRIVVGMKSSLPIPAQIITVFDALMVLVFALATIGWFVLFIPNRVLAAFPNAAMYGDKLLTLRGLTLLNNKLAAMYTPKSRSRAVWWWPLSNIDLRLHQLTVGILDYCKMLNTDVEAGVFLGTEHQSLAERMHDDFNNIPPDLGYDELLRAYRSMN